MPTNHFETPFYAAASPGDAVCVCSLCHRDHGRASLTSTATMLRLWYEGSVHGCTEHARNPFQASVMATPRNRRRTVHTVFVGAIVHLAMAPKMAQNDTHASARNCMATRFHKTTPAGETVSRVPPVLTWDHAVGLRALRNASHSL